MQKTEKTLAENICYSDLVKQNIFIFGIEAPARNKEPNWTHWSTSWVKILYENFFVWLWENSGKENSPKQIIPEEILPERIFAIV